MDIYNYLKSLFTTERIKDSLEICDKYYIPLNDVDKELFNAVGDYCNMYNMSFSKTISTLDASKF